LALQEVIVQNKQLKKSRQKTSFNSNITVSPPYGGSGYEKPQSGESYVFVKK